MTAPVKRSQRSLFREPSYIFLVIGIVLTAFGVSWLIGLHHPVIAVVITVVGLGLLIPARLLRSRSGRWP